MYLVNLIEINEPQYCIDRGQRDHDSRFESFETTSDKNLSGLSSIEESPGLIPRRRSIYENLEMPQTHLGPSTTGIQPDSTHQSPSHELSSYCHRRFTKKPSNKYKVLSEAFDDVTDIILKAAELVPPSHHRTVDESSTNRYSRKMTMTRQEEPG